MAATVPAKPTAAPAFLVSGDPQSVPKMPVDFNGYWKMLSNENFEEYLRALGKRRPAGRNPGLPADPSTPAQSTAAGCQLEGQSCWG